MNRLLLGLVLAASFALTGMARADGYNWTGFYVGANAGYAWGESQAHTTTTYSGLGYFAGTSVNSINSNGSPKLKPDGFAGGAQAGANFQSGNLVYGLEAEFGAYDLSKSGDVTAVYPCCGPTSYSIHQTVKSDWLFTLRPRIGWASDNLLVYATGGLAVTEIKYNEVFTDTFASALETASKSETKAGWALGAGLEYGLTPNVTLKGEYLYTDFGKVSTSATLTNPVYPTTVFNHSADLNSSIVRVGINYKF